MEPLVHLSYPLDREQLLKEANQAREVAQAYTDKRYPDVILDEWLISHYSSPTIQKIIEDFQVEGKPRFYFLKANAILPEHVDNGTECSLNFILSDNAAPVSFGDQHYTYSQVLLNTQIPHSVYNGDSERVLLKISIFNEKFDQLAKRIKFKS